MTTNNENEIVPCPRFLRTDRGEASEVLTLVKITDGRLAGHGFPCADLDGATYPYLVQITTGPETGDDFVGLYDLDGGRVDAANCDWEIVTEAPAEVVAQIERRWKSGASVVTRI